MHTENRNPESEQINLAVPPENVPSDPNHDQPQASRRRRYLIIAVVAAGLGVGLISGIVPRLRAQSSLAATVQEVARPVVTVTNANRSAGGIELILPGDVHAFEETRIYARADGYLLRWHSDIGAKVDFGQVLAEIDTPELDQELNQSRAALTQAQANLSLARSSADRWQGLLQDRAVSQQEVEEKAGARAARAADVQAAEAAVLRLEKLASFKEIRAPFAGTITRRLVDTGALVHAGGSGSALFELAQTDTLRVHVNVPQAYLRDVSVGAPAQVRVAEYPGRSFLGKIVRTSGAFDAVTRTLLTEIEVPNVDGALFPGINVDVQLSLAQANPPLVVPGTSILIRSEGPQVAVVDAHDVIRLHKVQLGRDLGQSVEIVDGLSDGARIVTKPNDTLFDGLPVRIGGGTQPAKLAPRLARR